LLVFAFAIYFVVRPSLPPSAPSASTSSATQERALTTPNQPSAHPAQPAHQTSDAQERLAALIKKFGESAAPARTQNPSPAAPSPKATAPAWTAEQSAASDASAAASEAAAAIPDVAANPPAPISPAHCQIQRTSSEWIGPGRLRIFVYTRDAGPAGKMVVSVAIGLLNQTQPFDALPDRTYRVVFDFNLDPRFASFEPTAVCTPG
jgi:hypothetical protein